MQEDSRRLGSLTKPSRRIILFCLFLILLSVSLMVAFNPFARPLRRDMIPPGAYVVPWMRPNPSILPINFPLESQPWNITAVMRGSLQLSMTFGVELPNGTRVIAGTLFLGHDLDYLYVGAILKGMYSNPTSDSNVQYPNRFEFFFDVEANGLLTFPESGSHLGVTIQCPHVPSTCGRPSDGWRAPIISVYNDHSWDYVPEVQRAGWVFAKDVISCTPYKGTWLSARGDWALEYNSKTGDLVILLSRRLSNAGDCTNALQMRHNELWVMGFLLEVGYQNEYKLYEDFMDGWPMRTHPYLSNDASWWPKMAIDLTNPPANL